MTTIRQNSVSWKGSSAKCQMEISKQSLDQQEIYNNSLPISTIEKVRLSVKLSSVQELSQPIYGNKDKSTHF